MELIIVMAIMAILLTLAVLGIGQAEQHGRNQDRATDVGSIGRALETYYASGHGDTGPAGRYPAIPAAGVLDDQWARSFLRDIDPQALRTPGSDTPALTPASNPTETPEGVRPQPATNQYVYQPIALVDAFTGGTRLCRVAAPSATSLGDPDPTCRRFNLYYRQEGSNQVIKHESRYR